MRTIYAAVAAFVVIGAILFGVSFLYLDRENHKIYHYSFDINGRDMRSIRIDMFRTEDKRIYKSATMAPFLLYSTAYKERITLDKNSLFEEYAKDTYDQNEVRSISIRKGDRSVSFVDRFGPRFACIDKIPAKANIFIFDETSPLTYMPVISAYDFGVGGAQAFETLTPLTPLSPPVKRLITLTSIKNEYLKIGTRKIKTENLILKIRGYPKGSVWVAKSDRAIIKIEIPDMGLCITRSFDPREVKAEKFVFDNEGKYSSKDVTFGSKKTLMSGTLSLPAKIEKSPAVVLVQGFGPQDRSYQGFFDSLADKLAREGFAVLRFDKRGSGASSGSSFSYTPGDEIEDIQSAVSFLSACEGVDGKSIAIIAHAEGADSSIRASIGNNSVKALALLSPSFFLSEEDRIRELRAGAIARNWTAEYLQLAERCIKETSEKVNNLKGDWANILDSRCFLSGMRDASNAPSIREEVKKINIPVLILQGKKDEKITFEYASMVDRSLEESGNVRRVMTYYGYLDGSLGKLLSDGTHRARYSIDDDVARDILRWLRANIPVEA